MKSWKCNFQIQSFCNKNFEPWKNGLKIKCITYKIQPRNLLKIRKWYCNLTTVFTFFNTDHVCIGIHISQCLVKWVLIYHFTFFFIFAVRLFRLNTKKYLDVWGGWDGNSLVLMTIFIVYFLRFDKKTTQGASSMARKITVVRK